MKIFLALLILLSFIDNSFSQTLSPGYVPCQLTGGSNPVSQNCSIYDTGSSSGAGNVGINSTNPGQRLDIQGTVRLLGMVEVGIPDVSSGGKTYACFDGSGNLISQSTAC